MKTRTEFKSYLIIWVMAVVVFNVLIFLLEQGTIGNRLTETTVIFADGVQGTKQVLKPEFLNLLYGYIFVMLAFVGQLIATKIFLSQETLKKTLYNYPIFKISLSGLIVTLIFALLFAVILKRFNPFITFVIFIITLIYTVARCIMAKTAANMVNAKDENIEIKTQYIKILKSETDSLYIRVESTKEKELVKKVVDAVKFSDPVSIPELIDIEKSMIEKLNVIKSNINVDKLENLKSACDDFLNLLNDRNARVKSLKK